jgi:hypothetical protein
MPDEASMNYETLDEELPPLEGLVRQITDLTGTKLALPLKHTQFCNLNRLENGRILHTYHLLSDFLSEFFCHFFPTKKCEDFWRTVGSQKYISFSLFFSFHILLMAKFVMQHLLSIIVVSWWLWHKLYYFWKC